VSWSGRVLARHPAPAGLGLHADTSAGLLVTIAPPGQGPTELQIVDPRTLAPRRRLGPVGYVVAATGTQAAWTSDTCTARCWLTVADLPSGTRHSVVLHRDFDPGTAAFSPDGRRLALGYFGRHPQQAGGAAPGFVEVTDLATGRTTPVPGVATGIKQTAGLAWTTDGRALAITVVRPDSDTTLAGLWPLPGGPVRVLPRIFTGAGAPPALTVLPAAP
jgi:hypothetical protein